MLAYALEFNSGVKEGAIADLFDDCVPEDHARTTTRDTGFTNKLAHMMPRDNQMNEQSKSFVGHGSMASTDYGSSFNSFGTMSFAGDVPFRGSRSGLVGGDASPGVLFTEGETFSDLKFSTSVGRRALQLSASLGPVWTKEIAPPPGLSLDTPLPTPAQHLGPIADATFSYLPQVSQMQVAGVPPPPPHEVFFNNHLSIGSLNHASGNCTPCKFFRGRRGCKDGSNCNLCHYPHEELTYSGIRRMMRLKTLAKGGK